VPGPKYDLARIVPDGTMAGAPPPPPPFPPPPWAPPRRAEPVEPFLVVLVVALFAVGIASVIEFERTPLIVPPPPPKLEGGTAVLAGAEGDNTSGHLLLTFGVPPPATGNRTGLLFLIVVNLTCGGSYGGPGGLPIVCDYSLIQGSLGGPTADYVWLDVPFTGVFVASTGNFTAANYTLALDVHTGTGGEAQSGVPFGFVVTIIQLAAPGSPPA